MDWQTLLTAFAGALGGTTTALVLVGIFGKTLLEHWFKKDFKRFEATLDNIASRDETKFIYLHPERAKIASEIYNKCTELRRGFNWLVITYTLKAHSESEQLSKRAYDQSTALLGEIIELEHYLETQTPLFTSEFAGTIQSFLKLLGRAVAVDLKSITSDKEKEVDVFNHNEIITQTQKQLMQLQILIEGGIKEMLGVADERK